MSDLRIGSLFSGTGQLDEAIRSVYGGDIAWHSQYEPPKNGKEDVHQYATKILAHHYPTVPNLGDITKVDWRQVTRDHGAIDILTGGFPCQDVSSAGKRAGLTADSRSGLWSHMAHAIHELQPELVVIENVQGLLSAQADRGLEPDAEALVDQAGADGTLRALGAVLGDLATLGFDAEWCRVAASEVGAPHSRKRVFILAWPAHADPADLGHERSGGARGRRPGSPNSGLAVANASSQGLEVRGVEPARNERQAAERGCGEPAADTSCGRCPGHGELSAQRDTLRGRVRHDVDGRNPPSADADSRRQREAVLQLRTGQSDLDWGDYGPAIRRWEHILGRRAPWPTDALGRLNPEFSEWMLGWPDGWVVDTPGLTRGAMLRAIGNGVCPQQAEAAIRLLAARAASHTAAAA